MAAGREREEERGYRDRLNRLIEIGISLSAELDLDVLLEKIVHHARELTNADGGTLYLLQDGALHFKIIQNASLGVFQGGTGSHINLPPVPLEKSNVSAYAAITGETIVVDDVYTSEMFDFTGPRAYDEKMGYRSKSMVVVPMKNHKGECIGVLQLLNALSPDRREVIPFHSSLIDLVRALASQAAIAISNTMLIRETKALFESLIKVLAVAVDAKSHYTGNHVHRVAALNVHLAEAVNRAETGPFAAVRFSEEEMEAIRLAGWLHDIGKVVTPVWIMDKAVKLEAITDRMEIIRLRFALIKALREIEKRTDPTRGSLPEADGESAELDEILAFLERCNRPGEFLEDAAVERLAEIAGRVYKAAGKEYPLLTEEERRCLSVRRGSLTAEEMETMRAHVKWTRKLLSEVPFTGALARVPLYAGQHHEKLDGSGYPLGLKAEEIPLPSRILAICDLYEALSATDRPYKKALPREKIVAILRDAAARGEIDADLLELMLREGVIERFEEEYARNGKAGDPGPREDVPSPLEKS